MQTRTRTHHPLAPFGRSLVSTVTEDKKGGPGTAGLLQARERKKGKGVKGCLEVEPGQRAGGGVGVGDGVMDMSWERLGGEREERAGVKVGESEQHEGREEGGGGQLQPQGL